MAERGVDWRVLDGEVTAWFDAPSMRLAASLADQVLELSPGSAIDVRTTGVQVRLAVADHAEAVSVAATRLGLAADPTVLQRLAVVVESPQPEAVRSFWQRAVGYEPGDGGLVDPLRRDPALRLRPSPDARPLRNRLHLDVVRPAAEVERAELGEAFGPYGVCRADADGNEVDLVPGDPLGDRDGLADWHVVFGAIACYRTDALDQQRGLLEAVARTAADVGFPLLLDVRPGLVIVDTGKDRWERAAHGLDVEFTDLAAHIGALARSLGATADPALARFVQLFVDAADVDAIRAFWATALRLVADGRPGLTDLVDPRRLVPELVFQPLDESDAERRAQRNRLHVELAVPADVAGDRVATTVRAGGRLLDDTDGRWRVADPEGNELVIVADGRGNGAA